MKRIYLLSYFLLLALLATGQTRKETYIPDIPGYQTLKCDFHMHSVFSDGDVWPTVRVNEAIKEKLDAIAITEHIEYRPYHRSGDMASDHNRAFVIASEHARKLPDSLIVIHGSEITRDMPPGHINAIFVQDSNPFDTPDWRDALKAAKAQGAFIFWNHPAWERQASDGIPKWYDEHTELYNGGYIMGLEIYGAGLYSPLAHSWVVDKNLAVFGNTDAHRPMNNNFPSHRNMTLVFATERSEKGIHDALLDRRTVAYNKDNNLCGDEKFLKPLLEASLSVESVEHRDQQIQATVVNASSLTFKLRSLPNDYVSLPGKITIGPYESVKVDVTVKQMLKQGAKVDFVVENFLSQPGQGMRYSYEL